MELKGKKINFLGDSITEGHGTSDWGTKPYHQLLKVNCGLAEARNYGLGGTKIARLPVVTDHQFDQDFNLRAPSMDLDADAIVVFGGTNDFGHGTIPLGTMDDRDVHTFYGGLHTLCLYLIKTYISKPIIFMTPLHRLNEVLDHNNRINEGNKSARPLIDFVNAIREVCEFYSIPVLDLYKESGMYGQVWAWCEGYMPDGLHPNDAGHEIIAHKLQKFLENL
ncbi:MAG: SGNH/GDSL hydrolase family protein [Ruminococcaceae bacterium]|nr:SGNH/GDSL hydrolase family protein [Oscillospiraceae bacterium]